jgi:AAA+ ATPase superfamily predicted ATPase
MEVPSLEVPSLEVPLLEVLRMDPLSAKPDAPSRPPDLVDRQFEWQQLSALWQSRRPQLGFVLGRRRIGKSYVLSRFARAVGGLYYQATKQTEAEQLAHLSRLLGACCGDEALLRGVVFPSWEMLFRFVTEKARSRPFLLILDEFPYLAAAAPALPSLIQRFWDHDWVHSGMKLVLSGSFVTAMTALEDADQPLYGRRTMKLVFPPFLLRDVAPFMPGFSAADRLRAYGTFGHLPGHLARIDAELSFSSNAAAALLDASGPLVDDATHMLDAFVADGRLHYSILEAVATGDHTWSGITRRVGQSGGAVLRPLRWLEEMGLLHRIVPITERLPQKSKRAIYRVADPYVTFWHRFVAPLLHGGQVGMVSPTRLWEQHVLPQLSEHMGPVFEEVCRQFVRAGVGLPFDPLRVGEWWSVDGAHQLDIVALDGNGWLFAGECKWGAVTREDLSALQRRAALLADELGGIRQISLGVFSARDEADASVRQAVATGEVYWYNAEDVGK